MIRTRFAPSPTGYLHIGGVRTALFNFLFAKHNGGKFLLRIEDTDLKRNSLEANSSITEGLAWLGITPDEEIVYQSNNVKRHVEIAYELVKRNKAYFCYATENEISDFKTKNPHSKFLSPYRNSNMQTPNGENYVIRLKGEDTGETEFVDMVQGKIVVKNEQIDDMVLLRSDKTPTYMLAVVVDDHDMGITHVIRGDDHLTNTSRQIKIYQGMGWELPQFAHIPLIHAPDGSKLSKRHGAVSILEYQQLGYLKEALINFLVRMGFGKGEEEVIDISSLTTIFELEEVSKAPSKFDIEKLNYFNKCYMDKLTDQELFLLIEPEIKIHHPKVQKGISLIRSRACTLRNLLDQAEIFVKKSSPKDSKSSEVLSNGENILLLFKLKKLFEDIADDKWSFEYIDFCLKEFATLLGIKFSITLQILRASIIGTFNSPSVVEVISILGKKETLSRLVEEMNL